MAPFHTVHGTFHVIIEEGRDGYLIGEAVGLPGCRSQGKTRDELLQHMREAIELYLEEEGDALHIPRFVALETVEV